MAATPDTTNEPRAISDPWSWPCVRVTRVAAIPDDVRLVDQFRQMGIEVDQALPAWTGIKPYAGGYGNWNFLLTQWRVLVWRGDTVELWTRWNGLPSKCLHSVPVGEVSIVRLGRRYDRVNVGSKRVWVPCRYRDLVAAESP